MRNREHEKPECHACAAEGSCGCCAAEPVQACREEERKPSRAWLPWLLLALAALCLGAMFLPGLDSRGWQLGLGLAASLLAGWRGIWNALRALARFKFNEGVLMLVAVAACFALGDFREAAAIALFFALGEQLEALASRRSRHSIAALAEIRPDTATLRGPSGEVLRVPAESVAVGSEVQLLPHERAALDGVVLTGASAVDTSALTGESLPREVGAGDTVLSGTVNGTGTLTLRTTARSGASAAARVLEMVEEAARRKGGSERFLARFAKAYTPIVMCAGLAMALIPGWITGDWAAWIKRGLAVLISACPCAIVLSVPLSFFAAIGGAARLGVLVKGGRYVEELSRVNVAAFDKTGTLTTDRFRLAEALPAGEWSREELLEYAAAAERYSAHPLAKAIREAGGDVEESRLLDVVEMPGGGVSAEYRGRRVLCGGRRLMEEHGVDANTIPDAQVYVAVTGALAGALRMESELHPDAPQALAELRSLGVRRLALLTGDGEAAARQAAERCGIEEVHAALLPEGKLAALERLKAAGRVLYVGDGINDAPVLALADVGVAMGLGAQAACEAADVILAGGSLAPLARARKLFRASQRVIRANVAFALAVKLAVIALNMAIPGGLIWLAVFADVGVLVLTVLNAMRLWGKRRALGG